MSVLDLQSMPVTPRRIDARAEIGPLPSTLSIFDCGTALGAETPED